ncbi:hypothetical protein NLG97_g429 [Lecanicillium saksenae]|uniref:Uncharacterized protein n=1 Tax=Lecanicillium saksenae TaxID=468837 RepID=A0ACC1R6V4_9HYPO|nr:hypothetical protein NLG97_g429 [Lecanicillium saksenae]
MASHGDGAVPPDGAPKDSPVKGIEGNESGKGKERAATFGERLQASGRMALNAAVPARPSLASSSGGDKATAGSGSVARNGASVSEPALSESSRIHDSRAIGDSLRRESPASTQASAQYDGFLNAGPQLQDTFHAVIEGNHSPLSRSFQNQMDSDGADVIDLLSMAEKEPNYSEFDELLSEEEATRLREAFFAHGASQPRWDHLLNFTPAFVLDAGNSHEARSLMGTEDTSAAHDMWLQQWHDVLCSYTDEVWGDLGSLVAEAKHEIETNNSHTDLRNPESKALDRLRQILAHVRGQP